MWNTVASIPDADRFPDSTELNGFLSTINSLAAKSVRRFDENRSRSQIFSRPIPAG
jgi:hypothetical protein